MKKFAVALVLAASGLSSMALAHGQSRYYDPCGATMSRCGRAISHGCGQRVCTGGRSSYDNRGDSGWNRRFDTGSEQYPDIYHGRVLPKIN